MHHPSIVAQIDIVAMRAGLDVEKAKMWVTAAKAVVGAVAGAAEGAHRPPKNHVSHRYTVAVLLKARYASSL